MRNINTILTSEASFFDSTSIRQFIRKTDIKIVNINAPSCTESLEFFTSASKYLLYFFEYNNICDMAEMECVPKEYKSFLIRGRLQ